ncbi:MAG: hypothetical protein ACC652_02655 [Acidimicrobiales bacterium]
MTGEAFVGLLAGFVVTAVAWRSASPIFNQTLFERENFRGRLLVTSSGLVLAPMMMFVAALVTVLATLDIDTANDIWLSTVVATVFTIGLVFLGLVDDLAGDGGSRGFRGHIGAGMRGQLTTGMVKLVGTVSLSLLVVSLLPRVTDGLLELVRMALLLSLFVNLANLFDLAPARAAKVSILPWLVTVLWHFDLDGQFGPALVVGGALLLALPELKEKAMLGDAGANALGGAIGVSFLIAWGEAAQWVAIAVALLLTVASEKVSFSSVIKKTPALHWLDMLGREPLDQTEGPDLE